jgi:hypothetical protein
MKLYYLGRNRLGKKHEQALDFGNIPGAMTFVVREKLPDMEIVLRYETCDGEVPIPLLPVLGGPNLASQGSALRPDNDG